MITYKEGDIFTSKMQTLVNPVNCQGVMGSGLAAQFKDRFPDMFLYYSHLCMANELTPDDPFLWCAERSWVLNLPTKVEWFNPSRFEYIEKGLLWVGRNWKQEGIESIAFPKLGAGRGALPWRAVKEVMEFYLKKLPMFIEIYV